MKGKRLYHLLNNLSKREKRQFHFICSKSSDKRHEFLKNLISSDVLEREQFSRKLEKLKKTYKHLPEEEQDKSVRRFVDFSSKEIENLLLKNLLDQNDVDRNSLLTEIFKVRNNSELFEFYSKKAVSIALKAKEHSKLNSILANRIVWKGRSQTKHDIKDIVSMLPHYEDSNEKAYHLRKNRFLKILANILEDHPDLMKDHSFKIPSDQEFAQLIENSPSPIIAVEYKISQARFQFNDYGKMIRLLDEGLEALEKIENPSTQYAFSKRSILFAKIVAGVEHGLELPKLTLLSNQLTELNAKTMPFDSLGMFFNLLFLVLNKRYDRVDEFKNNLDVKFFDEQNKFFVDFIEAITAYQNFEIDTALDLFTELSQAPTNFIALWSKLMELRIRINQRDNKFAQALVKRLKHFLKTRPSVFTFNSAVYCLKTLEQQLKGQESQEGKKQLFYLFELIIQQPKI